MIDYLTVLVGGAGMLAFLAYFDAYNNCEVPNKALILYSLFSIIVFVYGCIAFGYSTHIFDAVVFCILAVLFRVMRFWNDADVVAFAGIGLIVPQMAFTALIGSWAAYVLDAKIRGLNGKAVPFIPYLLAGYLVAVVLASLFSELRT